MKRAIELHVRCGDGLPMGLMADLGRAMAKVDKNATFSGCTEHDDPDCRFVYRAEEQS